VALTLTSSAFAAGGAIPARYTCDGSDSSPAMQWSGAPAGTQSLALVCADPDAPGRTFYHWAIYDIPATATSLPEHYPSETRDHVRQAINDFGRRGYGGPCPPRGNPHHYHFTLYALKVAQLPLAAAPRCLDVEAAAKQNAIEQAELIGVFGH
jgi:Raf kinase inhibitor-like YbhB/YbcL family protein